MDRKPPHQNSESRASQGHPPRAAQVLVVDDDPAVLMLLEETLLEAGFGVRSARSGDEAVEACADFTPDLALLDINMPVMDGIEACREIRRLCGSDFPIVMVTSVDDAMSIQSAFDAGASDFILKPINWPLFQRRMESIIQDWGQAAELNETQKRIAALQRVAPEQAMLVSRNGVVIEDLKERTSSVRPDRVASYPTLDELYGADVARRFKQCISAVLKTCQPKALRFTLDEWGRERECQADFQVDGRERVIVVVQSVSSEAQAAPREVYQLAFYDAVSGLPNEHLFRRVAKTVCADAALQSRPLALYSVGIEGVDEQSGSVNEALTRDAARIIAGCAAKHPGLVPIGDQESAERFARGDYTEFLLMLDNVHSADDVTSLLDSITRGFEKESPALTIAIGVAILPSDGNNPDVLIRAARGARKEAATEGDVSAFHGSAASVPVINTVDYAIELREALAQGQFELHYQPRVATLTGRVTAVEALLRWNHPMRGWVGLGEILHLAKATGMIFDLGDWVLETACTAAAGWATMADAPRVSINLSRQELTREGLVGRIHNALDRTGLDPARLELEVTEAALLRAYDTGALLSMIKALGIGLVLDDFGTGHSSLASLKNYPIDALKIDASFVNGSTSNSSDAAICEIIIMMAHKMGLAAIAEGVETEAALELMAEQGCDEIQGYLVSKPLPIDKLLPLIAGKQPPAE